MSCSSPVNCPNPGLQSQSEYKRWTQYEKDRLLQLTQIYINDKGNIDWKQVSENLGRSARKCQRQYQKLQDNFLGFIVNDEKPTTCHTRQNSSQIENFSTSQNPEPVQASPVKKEKVGRT